MEKTLFKCASLITNFQENVISPGAFLVENGIVVDRGPSKDFKEKYLKNTEICIRDFGESYILPGLINCHVHLCFPGDGTPAENFMNCYSDEVVSMVAAKNSQEALKSGLTTLRDLGGRNNITFSVRKAIEGGQIIGPRLILAGPPITITGGHMHYLNGEVDSKEEIKKKIRQIIKNGADCIKIIANGGGSKNTYPWKKSFELEELEVAIKEAHRFNKPVTAHVSCVEAMKDCLDAQIDGLEHCDFRINENEDQFDHKLADRIAKQGIFVGKTLPSTYRAIQKIEKSKQFSTLYQSYQLKEYNYLKNILNNSKNTFIELYKHGVQLVASTDAGWRVNPFNDFITDLELMVDCGLSTKEALINATQMASRALKMETQVGTLDIGKFADFIVVRKNPLEDISNLRNPQNVFIGGKEVKFT